MAELTEEEANTNSVTGPRLLGLIDMERARWSLGLRLTSHPVFIHLYALLSVSAPLSPESAGCGMVRSRALRSECQGSSSGPQSL